MALSLGLIPYDYAKTKAQGPMCQGGEFGDSMLDDDESQPALLVYSTDNSRKQVKIVRVKSRQRFIQ